MSHTPAPIFSSKQQKRDDSDPHWPAPVLERADGMRLDTLNLVAGALAPEAACRIGWQIGLGLVELHADARAHGTLATDRVVVEVTGNARLRNLVGLPPEQHEHNLSPERRACQGGPTSADDLYALGLLIAEIALGHPLDLGTDFLDARVLDGLMPERMIDAVAALLAPVDARLQNASAAVRMLVDLEHSFGNGMLALKKAVDGARLGLAFGGIDANTEDAGDDAEDERVSEPVTLPDVKTLTALPIAQAQAVTEEAPARTKNVATATKATPKAKPSPTSELAAQFFDEPYAIQAKPKKSHALAIAFTILAVLVISDVASLIYTAIALKDSAMAAFNAPLGAAPAAAPTDALAGFDFKASDLAALAATKDVVKAEPEQKLDVKPAAVADADLPSLPSMPDVHMPSLPSFSMPSLPSFSMPSFSLPSFSMPSLPSLPTLASLTDGKLGDSIKLDDVKPADGKPDDAMPAGDTAAAIAALMAAAPDAAAAPAPAPAPAAAFVTTTSAKPHAGHAAAAPKKSEPKAEAVAPAPKKAAEPKAEPVKVAHAAAKPVEHAEPKVVEKAAPVEAKPEHKVKLIAGVSSSMRAAAEAGLRGCHLESGMVGVIHAPAGASVSVSTDPRNSCAERALGSALKKYTGGDDEPIEIQVQ